MFFFLKTKKLNGLIYKPTSFVERLSLRSTLRILTSIKMRLQRGFIYKPLTMKVHIALTLYASTC